MANDYRLVGSEPREHLDDEPLELRRVRLRRPLSPRCGLDPFTLAHSNILLQMGQIRAGYQPLVTG
jgi:hypothetical protein